LNPVRLIANSWKDWGLRESVLRALGFLYFFVLTFKYFKTSKMLRDAARIQSVWPTLEEFGCSGCNAVAPWNNSNRGKYLLNFTRGIKMYQLCMFLPLFHHFPAYSTISIHFPVLTWAKVYYCSENTDSLCIRNKESHLLVEGGKFLCSRSNKS
jgi:hypothetical protein